MNTAARQAVNELDGRLYSEAIAALAADGYLDASVTNMGNNTLRVYVNRILPRGRREVGQWPAAPSAVTVGDRKGRRLVFMDALYEHAGDDTMVAVDVEQIAASLEWRRTRRPRWWPFSSPRDC